MRRDRNEDGAVTALVAALVMSGLLFGLAALVVDLGLARDQVQESQISSDASALAAANALYPANGADCVDKSDEVKGPCLNDAIGRAKALAKINFGSDDLSGCAVPSGFHAKTGNPSTCVSFYPSTSAPTKVSVIMPQRNVPTRFTGGNVSTVRSVPVNTSAQAAVAPGADVTCGLCFLGNVNTNNADFSIDVGSIAVGGSIDTASSAQSEWRAPNGQIQVVGTVNGQPPATSTGGSFDPHAVQAPAFGDPFESRPMPPRTGADHTATKQCANGTTLQPGIYHDLTVKNNATCTLAAGLYVITGTWDAGNPHSTLQSAAGGGVTLFFTCGPSGSPRPCVSPPAVEPTGGMLDGSVGNIAITGSAASISTTWPNFVLLYDRDNPRELRLQGEGESSLVGAVYAPDTTAKFNGTSAFSFDTGPIVLKSAYGVGQWSGISVTHATSTTVTKLPGDVWLDQ
jgi:hypothetical protein